MFGPAFAKGVPVFLGGFFVPTGTLRKKEECMPRPMHGWSHYAWIAKEMGKNQAQVSDTIAADPRFIVTSSEFHVEAGGGGADEPQNPAGKQEALDLIN